MLTFLTYFVLVINGNRINRFHLFWDTLYICRLDKLCPCEVTLSAFKLSLFLPVLDPTKN